MDDLTPQEKALIECIRQGPFSRDPRFDAFRIEIDHQTGVYMVMVGGNAGSTTGIGPTFAAAWDDMDAAEHDEDDEEEPS